MKQTSGKGKQEVIGYQTKGDGNALVTEGYTSSSSLSSALAVISALEFYETSLFPDHISSLT